MKRKQLYSEITSLNLQSEVIKRYGDVYTRVSNDKLEALIKEVHDGLKAAPCKGLNAFKKLIEILAKKNILLKSEVDAIVKS